MLLNASRLPGKLAETGAAVLHIRAVIREQSEHLLIVSEPQSATGFDKAALRGFLGHRAETHGLRLSRNFSEVRAYSVREQQPLP
jgi:hypothetical protein